MLRFLETGGGNLSHDYGFIAAHLRNCRQETEKMLKKKAARKDVVEDIQQQASL